MWECKDVKARAAFYLDGELCGDEKASLEAHLKMCRSCYDVFRNEGRFLEMVRQSAPLYTPSAGLAERVRGVIGPVASDVRLKKPWAYWSRKRRVFAAILAVALIALLTFLIIPSRKEQNRGVQSEFALMAVDTHLRHQRGQLPLEINSDSPHTISTWFEDKVPFRLKLPNFQESSGQEKLYRLDGARLVGFNKDYAAYVSYRMENRPISLVVTSNSVVMPAGGEEIVSKGLRFHFYSIDGLKVISWADRGLTYALVSDLEERGQNSCLVCHQGTQDREFIEELKPRGF
jgi:anti-sigma factor RsiW